MATAEGLRHPTWLIKPCLELSTAPVSSFGPCLLPAALTSCSGHGSETSRTFRATLASTLGARSLALLPCSQEQPCLLGGTRPLRQTRGLSPPELPGCLPVVPGPGCLITRLDPSSPWGAGQPLLPCAHAVLVVSPAYMCTLTHTHACTRMHAHAHRLAHACAHTEMHTRSSIVFEDLCPLSTP